MSGETGQSGPIKRLSNTSAHPLRRTGNNEIGLTLRIGASGRLGWATCRPESYQLHIGDLRSNQKKTVNSASTPNSPSTDPVAEPAPTSPRRRILRRRWLVVAVLVFALCAVAVWQAVTASTSNNSLALVDRSNQPAPAFALSSLTQPARTISLADFRGRPLVVNFWASWCVPCRTEMPLLEKAHLRHPAVAFLGIDVNDTTGSAVAFLHQVHVTYPAASDANGTVAVLYGLIGLPITVFISPNCRIAGRHIGQLSESSLTAALEEAFYD